MNISSENILVISIDKSINFPKRKIRTLVKKFLQIKKARKMLKKKYKITHSTLQVEDTSGKHTFRCGHDLHQ